MELAEAARLNQKFRYDKKHKPVDLDIGDLVLWWWDKPLDKDVSYGIWIIIQLYLQGSMRKN
jgi:hypothetical protein